MSSSYDDIAGMYDAFWSDWYLPAALPALNDLFFSRLPVNAQVLDVCCGSGHVTAELVRRGYVVTGVDRSAELIGLARCKLPTARFYIQDVEQLSIDDRFDAALSTFDSLNHILSLEGIQRAFIAVHRHLKPGGLFVFDMNLEEAYALDLSQWNVTLTDDSAGLVRGHYDRVTKKAETEVVWFVRKGQDDLWARRRSVVEQRCYAEGEIVMALQTAGFRNIEALMAEQAGMEQGLAMGRVFFIASRK